MGDQEKNQTPIFTNQDSIIDEPLTLPGSSWQGKQIGRYKIEKFLGAGGMGVVLKAHDPELNRTVAIKVLQTADEVLRQRFLREARSQARVEHSHLCRIFDTGEHNGQPFIVMQYIEGQDLKHACPSMSIEEKAKVIKEAAEGLQAAHTVGLIHRDVKPSNILVERGAADEWIPFVTDFGLAREQAEEGLTETGAVLGTPQYMSPEQVQGEVRKLDRRTDVYSLGATLYEILAGEPAFGGVSTVQVLVNVIMADPLPLRQRCPHIPTDLATIVMKCLNKNPLHRYQSARALADDLGHFLDGEPITARPISLPGRVAIKVRRHKAVAVTLGLAFLLVAGFAGYALRTWRNAREQATLAERFGTQAKEIESIMRFAYLLPLHDVRPEKAMVRKRMKGIEDSIRTMGPDAAAFGHYALGRGYLTLHEFRPALRELTLAGEGGPQIPQVKFALGRVLGELYKEAKENVSRIDNPEERNARQKEIDVKYRDPAVRFLEASRGVKGESPAFVQGLMAFYQGSHEESIRYARQAASEIPWLYEARALEGEAWLEIGVRKAAKGEYKDAFENWKKADMALQQAMGVARSDGSVFEAYERLWGEEMIYGESSGQLPEDAFKKAGEACRIALAADPENAWMYCLQSRLFSNWAGHLLDHGENPGESIRKALDSAQTSVKLDPSSEWPLIEIGGICIVQAYDETCRGVDPRHTLDLGIQSLQQASRINPNSSEIADGLGNLYEILADFEFSHGDDPRPSIDQAVAAFEKAIRTDPGKASLFNNLGYLLGLRGQFERERGIDPAPSYHRALVQYHRASEAMPEDYTAANGTGLTQGYLSVLEMKAGKDPRPLLTQAVQELERATRMNPHAFSTWLNLGFTYFLESEYELSQGLDPRPSVDRAIAMYRHSLSIDPKDYYSLRDMASVLKIRGEFEYRHNIDPTPSLDGARKALRQAHEINPKDLQVFFRESKVECLGARWALRQGKSPRPFFAKAESACEQSLVLSSGKDFLFQGAAEMWRLESEWLLQEKRAAQDALARGIAMASSALQLNPRNDAALAEQGVLRLLQAKQMRDPAGRTESVRLAESDLSAALRMNLLLKRTYGPYLEQARLMMRGKH